MEYFFFEDFQKRQIKEALLTTDAERWANSFNRPEQPRERWQRNPKLTSAQLRNFYHEAKSLEEICKNSDDRIEKFRTMRPLVKMLKSKVSYACPVTGRDRKVPVEFKEFIDTMVDNVQDWDDFRAFMLCFEAVVGYFYGLGGR